MRESRFFFELIQKISKLFLVLTSNVKMRIVDEKISDNDFVSALKDGNNRYFSLLINKYKVYVLNICHKFLFNREDAEDTAQEVFAEVWLSIDKFRGDSSLSTWIYQIATRKSLDLIRKKNRKKRISFLKGLVGLEEAAETPAGREYNPEDSFYSGQVMDLMKNAMEKLAENQKTAFVLSKMEDLSTKEIANVMKTSEPSVISLIHRAKANLREILKKNYPGESFLKK